MRNRHEDLDDMKKFKTKLLGEQVPWMYPWSRYDTVTVHVCNSSYNYLLYFLQSTLMFVKFAIYLQCFVFVCLFSAVLIHLVACSRLPFACTILKIEKWMRIHKCQQVGGHFTISSKNDWKMIESESKI